MPNNSLPYTDTETEKDYFRQRPIITSCSIYHFASQRYLCLKDGCTNSKNILFCRSLCLYILLVTVIAVITNHFCFQCRCLLPRPQAVPLPVQSFPTVSRTHVIAPYTVTTMPWVVMPPTSHSNSLMSFSPPF